MRLSFMGTPAFAVPTLQALVDAGHEILAVYTQPDKPRGRGMQPSFSPVKELAVALGIPVRQPVTLKNNPEELAFFQSLSLDLAVVVAYGKLLPSSFLETPKLGCINGHGSILPYWRGAAPIQWAILSGDQETGITAMKMAEGMDEGDMLLVEKTAIGKNETYPELSQRLSLLCAPLMVKTAEALQEGTIYPISQVDTGIAPTFASMIQKEMGNLDFAESAETIHHRVCALQPWPGSRFQYGGKWVKVFDSAVVEFSGKIPAGTVLETAPLTIACGENAISFAKVQMEGKKPVTGEDFCRGYRLKQGDILV